MKEMFLSGINGLLINTYQLFYLIRSKTEVYLKSLKYFSLGVKS
jgi:hypothetical protein